MIEAAVRDRRQEPKLFRALLEATVYAHAPLSDDAPRLRLIQFIRPDGLTVLPCFTDRGKAERAGQGAVRIVSLPGRRLLEITLGATLMINPNDHHCTLYPEEIRTLLATGEVAVLDQVNPYDGEMQMELPAATPAWLIDALCAVFCPMAVVQRAYLIAVRRPSDSHATLLIVVAVPMPHLERVARAATTAIQSHCQAAGLEIDLTGFDPDGPPPTWLELVGAAPFYTHTYNTPAASPKAVH